MFRTKWTFVCPSLMGSLIMNLSLKCDLLYNHKTKLAVSPFFNFLPVCFFDCHMNSYYSTSKPQIPAATKFMEAEVASVFIERLSISFKRDHNQIYGIKEASQFKKNDKPTQSCLSLTKPKPLSANLSKISNILVKPHTIAKLLQPWNQNLNLANVRLQVFIIRTFAYDNFSYFTRLKIIYTCFWKNIFQKFIKFWFKFT